MTKFKTISAALIITSALLAMGAISANAQIKKRPTPVKTTASTATTVKPSPSRSRYVNAVPPTRRAVNQNKKTVRENQGQSAVPDRSTWRNAGTFSPVTIATPNNAPQPQSILVNRTNRVNRTRSSNNKTVTFGDLPRRGSVTSDASVTLPRQIRNHTTGDLIPQ